MRRKEKTRENHVDFLLIDVVALLLSFVLAYLMKFGDFGFMDSSAWMSLLFIASLTNLVICLFSDPYSGILRRPYYEELIRSLLQTVYNVFAAGIIFYVFKIGVVFSRQTVLTMYALYFVLSFALKCFWKWLIVSKKVDLTSAQTLSLFVIADGDTVADVLRNARAGDFNAYEIKGLYIPGSDEREIQSIPVIGCGSDVAQYVVENGFDEVLIATKDGLTPEAYAQLIANGVGLNFSVQSLLGFQSEDYAVDTIGVHKTLSVGKYTFTAGQSFYFLIKRGIDILASLVGCVLLIPITFVIKLVYLLHGDKAPLFYTQTRVGKGGRRIKLYKYRTMVPNADEVLEEMLKDRDRRSEWEESQKFVNDPRITKAGAWLRKTSLDELPQLLNVLKGEMSLVGPRPLVVGELEAHGGLKLYQQIKPGITGWWGCNGRSNIDYTERLELEYYYIRNVSAYLDFLCILRTAVAVLKRDGAS